MRRTLASRVGLLALVLAASGCGASLFDPATLHRTAADGVAVRLTRLRLDPTPAAVTVGAQYRVAPGTALGGWARLAPASGEPCREGVAPVATVDVHERARALHHLGLSFPRAAVDATGLFARPTALDLLVVSPSPSASVKCLRVAVTNAGTRDEWVAPPKWFLGEAWRLFGWRLPDDRVALGSLLEVRVGSWLGPLRWRVVLALGFNAIVPSVAIDALFIRVGRFALGIEMGYEAGFMLNANLGESRPMFGPRVGVRLANVPESPRWPGFRQSRWDVASANLEMFVARWSPSVGLDAAGAIVLGLAVGLDAGFLRRVPGPLSQPPPAQ